MCIRDRSNIPPASKNIKSNETAAIASSIATNAATNEKTAAATQQGAGTVPSNAGTTGVLGSYAMTPQQLEASGHLKPGSSTAVNVALAQGKPLSEAIPANAWTGKDGAANLDNFIGNKNAQGNAVSTLIGKSEGALVEKGVITGKESISQTGGLIMATASAGIGPVSNFVKTATGALGAATSLTSKLPAGVLNPNVGSVEGLIASGKQAANLLDKSMSGLAGAAPAAETPQGVAKGLFDKIVSGFKAMKASVPQNLTSINAKNKAEQEGQDAALPTTTVAEAATAATDSKATGASLSLPNISATLGKAFNAVATNNVPGINLSNVGGINVAGIAGAAGSLAGLAKKAGDSLSSVTPSGVDNLPGGAASISNTVQGNLPANIPGTGDIKGTLAQVGSAASGAFNSITGAVSGLKSKVASAGGLASFAGLGLSSNDLAKLQGSISSVSAGGPSEIKLPTTAESTNDVGGLVAQSKSLLGNKIIPSLSFGGVKPKILSPAESTEYAKLTEEKEKLTDKGFDLQKEYRNAKAKYGSSSAEAEQVWKEYAANQTLIDEIAQKLLNLAQGPVST
jgi:hypothetical protein